MLTLTPLTPAHPDLPQVMALMERSFPANERLEEQFLFDPGDGSRDFLAIHHEGKLCGFISLISWQDITHIIFFAIEESMRGQGLGGQALMLLRSMKKGRLIADVESEDPAAENLEQRKRRRQFYLRCGYEPTSIHYRWRDEEWDIFSSGGQVSQAEFSAFWQHF